MMTSTTMVIGITGGIGSGKSTVLKILKNNHDALVILADELAHDSYNIGTDIYKQLIAHFGEAIRTSDGSIDRAKLAQIIFQSEEERTYVNSLIHPYVLDRIKSEIDKNNEGSKPHPLLVVETAQMFETGCNKLCDEVWCVISDRETKIKRLMETRNYTREKAESIMATQTPDEEQLRQSDRAINNNQTIKELETAIATTVASMEHRHGGDNDPASHRSAPR